VSHTLCEHCAHVLQAAESVASLVAVSKVHYSEPSTEPTAQALKVRDLECWAFEEGIWEPVLVIAPVQPAFDVVLKNQKAQGAQVLF
jgi:hypothetical protein